VAPAEHRIDSTTPGDPAGWIDAEGLAAGVVLVTVPHGIWATFLESAGDWDIVADGEGVRRCLVRGRWYTEGGLHMTSSMSKSSPSSPSSTGSSPCPAPRASPAPRSRAPSTTSPTCPPSASPATPG
jgi:hypothetical protein